MPGHVPARAHGAQRGRGPRPCAAREGTAVSCQVDGTRPGESPAGRRPGSAAVLPREPHRCGAARERGMPDPEACVVCGANDLGDELCEVADRGRPTDEAHGPSPGGRGRGSVRHGRRPPGPRPGAPRACVSRHDATPAREAVRGELGMVNAMHARPEGFLARLGGSRWGGPATTPAGSCGTSRRGGRTPTGRTPCRARRRRGATTTRGSPSRGSRSPSGPTGGISWPCRRWSNREAGKETSRQRMRASRGYDRNPCCHPLALPQSRGLPCLGDVHRPSPLALCQHARLAERV